MPPPMSGACDDEAVAVVDVVDEERSVAADEVEAWLCELSWEGWSCMSQKHGWGGWETRSTEAMDELCSLIA